MIIMIDKKTIEKLMRSKKIQKNIQALQDIVDDSDDITSISISTGDKEVKFIKGKKTEK